MGLLPLLPHGTIGRVLLWLALSGLCAPTWAGQSGLCDPDLKLSATQQDRLLRFAAIVKDELNQSGQAVALVARSGLDLARFDLRYSHAGFSLQTSENGPWSVRQLYLDCRQHQPRIFDQGMSGFVVGGNDPDLGYVSLIYLPLSISNTLAQRAGDNALALQLLGHDYSANAYAYALRYQNCNQWVVELLANAWEQAEGGQTPQVEPLAHLSPDISDPSQRALAQAWLKAQHYAATDFQVHNPLLVLYALSLPWLHADDHPLDHQHQGLYQVSMPASIEAFVHALSPEARRVELCHRGDQVVVHEGWDAIADGCQAGGQDRVISLD